MKKKQVIRLNESQLRRIVSDSVKRVLNEIDWSTALKASNKRMYKANQLYGKYYNGTLSPEEQQKFNKNRKSFEFDRRAALEKLISKYVSKYPELEFKLAPTDWNGSKLYCDIRYKNRTPHFHMTIWADGMSYRGRIKVEVIQSDNEGYYRKYPNIEEFETECPEMYELYKTLEKELDNFYSKFNDGSSYDDKPYF